MNAFLFQIIFLILRCQTIKTGGNRVNSASKKMKKQVLNQLESLIKKFNEKNVRYDSEYVMEKPMQYMRGHYSVNIRYNMFYSTDMKELMEFIMMNGLILRLGFYNNISQPYLDIQ